MIRRFVFPPFSSHAENNRRPFWEKSPLQRGGSASCSGRPGTVSLRAALCLLHAESSLTSCASFRIFRYLFPWGRPATTTPELRQESTHRDDTEDADTDQEVACVQSPPPRPKPAPKTPKRREMKVNVKIRGNWKTTLMYFLLMLLFAGGEFLPRSFLSCVSVPSNRACLNVPALCPLSSDAVRPPQHPAV